MLTDLHSHSTRSDGRVSPDELVSLAVQNSVARLAMTDHDLVFFAEYEPSFSLMLEIISGTELSCTWAKQTIHVLGLNMHYDKREAIEQHCSALSEGREKRALIIADKLEKLGMLGAYNGALEQAEGGQIGRPHFARWMVNAGYVKDMSAAFKKYLGQGKVGDVKSEWPHISEAVAAIRASGGTPVLAHPKQYRMTNTKMRALITDFKSMGGQGLEVSNGYQPADQVAYLTTLANQFGLAISAGSDFHGPATPYHRPGGFTPLPENGTPIWELWN
ncbi:PHP domain-containing protein [Pokkaliibacter sp. CJK22405]|uniref:PHP domain-containing protein n=1 Tax=Pokkaliibacter sp. CJK22405 TaxID=3384615 RepID=UPI003984688E